jgi:hypothetical protein
MFYKIKDPPQWLLDGLLAEETKDPNRKCPDCQVSIGMPHLKGTGFGGPMDECDIAHCLNTGIQRLQCGCRKCGDDIWTGLWPGVKECYDLKLVCFDTATTSIMFDLNAASILRQNE